MPGALAAHRKARVSATRLQKGADMADTEEIEHLVPDPVVCKEFGVTSMTLYRWDHDPAKHALGWPPKVQIGTRNYRNRKQLEAFKRNLLKLATATRKRGAA